MASAPSVLMFYSPSSLTPNPRHFPVGQKHLAVSCASTSDPAPTSHSPPPRRRRSTTSGTTPAATASPTPFPPSASPSVATSPPPNPTRSTRSSTAAAWAACSTSGTTWTPSISSTVRTAGTSSTLALAMSQPPYIDGESTVSSPIVHISSQGTRIAPILHHDGRRSICFDGERDSGGLHRRSAHRRRFVGSKPISLWPGTYFSRPSPTPRGKRDPRHSRRSAMPVRPRLLRCRRANWLQEVRLGGGRAFSTSFQVIMLLRDQYRNPWNEIRMGKLVEDVDALAGAICRY